jgi:hypothetical protein
LVASVLVAAACGHGSDAGSGIREASRYLAEPVVCAGAAGSAPPQSAMDAAREFAQTQGFGIVAGIETPARTGSTASCDDDGGWLVATSRDGPVSGVDEETGRRIAQLGELTSEVLSGSPAEVSWADCMSEAGFAATSPDTVERVALFVIRRHVPEVADALTATVGGYSRDETGTPLPDSEALEEARRIEIAMASAAFECRVEHLLDETVSAFYGVGDELGIDGAVLDSIVEIEAGPEYVR